MGSAGGHAREFRISADFFDDTTLVLCGDALIDLGHYRGNC